MGSTPKKIILVAEDDMYLAHALQTKLAKELFEVHVVTDGARAVEAALAIKPDLMLLDLVMPVMDGFATLVKFKSDEKLKNIPIIVITNLGGDEDATRAKGLGAAEYLVKSNTPVDDLVEVVRKFVV